MNNLESGIRDNYNRGNVGDYLSDSVDSGAEMSIVSAYFTIYAYECLKGTLDNIEHLNFLFGEPTYLNDINPNKAKMEFSIVDNGIQIPIEKRLQQKRLAKECYDWIEEKVSIRSMIKPNFLHGKLYHYLNPNGVEGAIMGSSNFTKNGLGFGNTPNIELNLISNDRRDVKDLKRWFDEVWNSTLSEDKKEYVLQILAKLYAENDPQFIYYKTLYHLFEAYLEQEEQEGFFDTKTGFLDSIIWNTLYDFQREGTRAAINKILRYNGCIIADSVGLGKTYEALAVIKYFELKNESILVLCPKKLRENWTNYLHNHTTNPFYKDRFRYTVLSHTDLTRENGSVGDLDLSLINWGNFNLVVIDESHNFRNAGKNRVLDDGRVQLNRYSTLMQNVIKSGVKTKVLMLSATPVNNYLRDLRNQIFLITEEQDNALHQDTGILSITDTIKRAQTQFTNWTKDTKDGIRASGSEFLEKLDSSFFKLLDTLTIARSRKHIKQFYNIEAIGSFPHRYKPDNIYSKIDTLDAFPSYDELNNKISAYRLSVYKPSEYLLPEYVTKYLDKKHINSKVEFDQKTREYFLIGMMKVNFLKRLESSVASFELTLKRTIAKIESLEKKILDFREKFSDTEQLEIDKLFDQAEEEEDEDMLAAIENWKTGKKLEYRLCHLDLERWLKDLKVDKIQIESIYNKACNVTVERDLKFIQLKQLIKSKTQNPFNELPPLSNNEKKVVPNKKVIIFTAFAETASYLYSNLVSFVSDELGLHIAIVTGGNSGNKTTYGKAYYNDILTNFSPRSKNRTEGEEEIDILIASDCISEGQNLQDCDYLINYDIHWNPVRIIQRFGRIDRIGSTNKSIKMVNFWPTKDLEKYINLKNRVEARMAMVDLTATADENVLDQDHIHELFADDIRYREKQLLRLREEVLDLEDMDDQISLTDFSLDDFRRELSNFLKENEKRLKNAPLGMNALVPAPSSEYAHIAHYDLIEKMVSDVIQPGVIFCLRHLKDERSAQSVNPLHPYYLVYIYQNGSVRFNYTSAKKILEMYRLLCSERKEPYQLLCDLFNERTNQGSDTDNYSQLMLAAVERIKAIFSQRNQSQLFNRGGKLLPENQQIKDPNEFELITWLIIE